MNTNRRWITTIVSKTIIQLPLHTDYDTSKTAKNCEKEGELSLKGMLYMNQLLLLSLVPSRKIECVDSHDNENNKSIYHEHEGELSLEGMLYTN